MGEFVGWPPSGQLLCALQRARTRAASSPCESIGSRLLDAPEMETYGVLWKGKLLSCDRVPVGPLPLAGLLPCNEFFCVPGARHARADEPNHKRRGSLTAAAVRLSGSVGVWIEFFFSSLLSFFFLLSPWRVMRTVKKKSASAAAHMGSTGGNEDGPEFGMEYFPSGWRSFLGWRSNFGFSLRSVILSGEQVPKTGKLGITGSLSVVGLGRLSMFFDVTFGRRRHCGIVAAITRTFVHEA